MTSLIFVFSLLCSLVSSRYLFSYSNSSCNPAFIGDGICDVECMMNITYYDSPLRSGTSLNQIQSSDCFTSCINKGCAPEKLGNGACDQACNVTECGWDMGECDFCAGGCAIQDLTSSVSKAACNTSTCMFGNNYYGWCAFGCFYENLTSSVYVKACNTSTCAYQNGLALTYECSAGCSTQQLSNEYCDEECNNSPCNYDNGVCLCAPGCTPVVLASNTCDSNDPCVNEQCNYKNYKCGTCAQGCFQSMLGDGVCNSQCNNKNCSYDEGDCTCAPGCNSYFDGSNWHHEVNDCSQACLVEACLFNYFACNNSYAIRAGMLMAILGTQTPANSIANPYYSSFNFQGNCTFNQILQFNSNNLCPVNSTCNTAQNLYCNGYSQNTASGCYLSGTGPSGYECLIEQGQSYAYLVPLKTIQNLVMPSFFQNISDLNKVFGNVTFYFLASGSYKKSSPTVFSVNQNGGSFYQALIDARAPYSSIKISAGNYPLVVDMMATIYFYRIPNQSSADPLYSVYSMQLNELIIAGDSLTTTTVYYRNSTSGLVYISAYASNVYIANITFSGAQIYNQNCSTDTCIYCPYLKQISGSLYINDMYQILMLQPNNSDYNINCDHLDSINFFVSTSGNFFFENVVFSNIRSNFNALISVSNDLTIKNVTFDKIQPYSQKYVITFTCTSGCSSVNFVMNNSNVIDFNYGFEDYSSIIQGGFISASLIGSVIFYNVSFKYDMAYSCSSCMGTQFLYFSNIQGEILIDSCVFNNIYTNKLIVIDDSDLSFDNFDIDIYGRRTQYTITHFMVSNSVFSNIYAGSSFISIDMTSPKININITNSVFSNIVTTNSGIFILRGSILSSSSEDSGNFYYEVISLKRYYIENPPRFLKISNVTITNLKFASKIFDIQYYPNTIITNLTITDCGAVSSKDIYDLVLINFKNANKYLNMTPPDSEMVIGECTQLISITYLNSLTMNNTYFSNNYCNTSYYSYFFLNYASGMLIFYNYTALNTQAYSLTGLALHVSNIQSIYISNISLFNITNDLSNVVYIGFSTNLTMNNVNFKQVSSVFNILAYIESVYSASLQNFECDYCSSVNGDAGALKIVMNNFGNYVGITSFYCNECTAQKGAGVLYIDSETFNPTIQLNFENITILNSKASEGIVYLSKNLKLENALINYLDIHNCTSEIGGIIEDYHSGDLLIDYYYSKNNTALYTAINSYYKFLGNVLNVSNTIVKSCSSQNQAFHLASISNATIVYFFNVTIDSINSKVETLLINSLNFIGDSLQFSNLYSYGISLSGYANAYLSNSNFINMTTSAIYSSIATFTCMYCNFVSIQDTVIVVIQEASVVFHNSNFTNCYSSSGPSIFSIINALSYDSNFVNCLIENNNAENKGVFDVQTTNVYLFFTKIINNVSANPTWSTGIILYNSNLYVHDSEFANQTMNYIYSQLQSKVYIYNTIFINLTEGENSAIYSDSSELFVDSSSFYYLNGDKSNAAAINFLSALLNTLIINGSEFKENSGLLGSCIYLSAFYTEISNSTFTQFYSQYGAIYTVTGSLSITNSQFHDNHFGSAIWTNGISVLTVSECTFYNLNSTKGAGIYATVSVSPKNFLSISGSQFFSNTVQGSGGAIYVSDLATNISDSTFYNNTANQGGAIFFSSASYSSFLTISGESSFVANKCPSGSGGAVAWTNTKPIVEDSVIFHNNTASYGNNFAGVPVAIRPLTVSRQLSTAESVLTITNVPPGQAFNGSFALYLYDSYGNIVNNINNYNANIGSLNASAVVSGNTSVTSVNGSFTFNGFIVSAPQGSTQYLQVTIPQINPSDQSRTRDNTSYSSTYTIEAKLRNCTYGEQINPDSCIECAAGKYLIYPSDSCLSCPTGANCTGGFGLFPLAGYWRSNNFSDVVYSCPVSAACLGYLFATDYSGTCANGYQGHLCGVCSVGYSLSTDSKCSKCPTTAVNAIILFFLIILIVLIGIVMVKSTLQSAFSTKSLYSIYIKIFTNYLQIVFLTTQFNLNWPSYVIQLFSYQKSAATASDQVFSIDCYFTQGSSSSTEMVYYYKVILSSMLPLIIWGISFCIWLFIGFLHDTNSYLKRELFTTMIVLFFLVHPNIVKVIFGSISCKYLSGIGYWLNDNLEIQCWDTSHIQMVLIVTIPSIILWVIGVPISVLIIMVKRKKSLSKDVNRIIFGFLYNGYKNSTFFWEFVILYRKILIICISVFMSTGSTLIQALTVIILLFFALYLQYSQLPYNHTQLNNMELEAITTASITIYCGLYYLSDSINSYFETILFLIILGGNVYFCSYWIYYMMQAVFEIFLKYFPYWKKYFKRGDGFHEKFYEESIPIQGSILNQSDGTKVFTFLPIQTKEIKEELKGIDNMDDFYKEFMLKNGNPNEFSMSENESEN